MSDVSMMSLKMVMSRRHMLLFTLLCAKFVRCSGDCPGSCSCSGTFDCDIAIAWPKIQSIDDPASVTKLKMVCSGNGSLSSLSGIEAFTSLTWITINNCPSLSDIPGGIFKHANAALTNIDLSNNAILYVHGSSFVGLDKLEKLNLNGNRIQDLPPSTFLNLGKLKCLNLKDNKIVSLPTGLLANNKALVEIDMSTNKLSQIEADDFRHLQNMETLILTSNKIRTLASKCFDTGTSGSLRNLYLSSNAIDYIDDSMFPKKLEKLLASGNSIMALSTALLSKLDSLKEFHLGQNPFHCNCEILALVRYIKQNKVAGKVDVTDISYKCATPFVANLDDVTEANVTCLAPKAEPIEWDDVDDSAVCRGSGDPAPVVTWTVSGKELVRVVAPRNRTVLHTEARLAHSAWQDGSTHQCRVSTAYGLQYQTFFLRVDVEFRNRTVRDTPPIDGGTNFIVVVVAVVVTFLVTLLLTTVATVAVMKRRSTRPTQPPSNDSFDVPLPPQAASDNLSSHDVRRDDTSRRRRHRRSKTTNTVQNSRNTYTDQHRNDNVTSDVNYNKTPPSDSVYEALDETTREAPVTVEPVYTELPDVGLQNEQSTVTSSG